MSERLIMALENVKTLPVITLEAIIKNVKEEALLILCLMVILPFLQPIPIPGVSSVLGFILILQGLGLMLWRKPLLTRGMKKITISHERFNSILKAALKFSTFISKLSAFKHPVVNTKLSHILCGLSIMFAGAFISLPLPIPFSNFIPALGTFMICIALLEEDIILLILGHGIVASVLLMVLFSYGMIKEQILSWF